MSFPAACSIIGTWCAGVVALLFLEAGAMKTIAVTLLTALCWLVAREAVWGQSALQRLEEMIRQPKAASGTAPAKPPESPAPPKAAATQPAPSPEPGYLGVLADDKDDRGRGVRVLKVTPGGPADRTNAPATPGPSSPTRRCRTSPTR